MIKLKHRIDAAVSYNAWFEKTNFVKIETIELINCQRFEKNQQIGLEIWLFFIINFLIMRRKRCIMNLIDKFLS